MKLLTHVGFSLVNSTAHGYIDGTGQQTPTDASAARSTGVHVMPYAHRSALGEIDSLHREPLPGASEFIANDHPDVQRFVGNPSLGETFTQLDAEFVRVIEDVIDTLIMKNLLAITDLPAQAHAKLFTRKGLRDKLHGKSLRLFPNSGFSQVIDDTGFGPL